MSEKIKGLSADIPQSMIDLADVATTFPIDEIESKLKQAIKAGADFKVFSNRFDILHRDKLDKKDIQYLQDNRENILMFMQLSVLQDKEFFDGKTISQFIFESLTDTDNPPEKAEFANFYYRKFLALSKVKSSYALGSIEKVRQKAFIQTVKKFYEKMLKK